MILAPTLSLSAGSGAAIARPTFSRDFAGEKTLNNGTGPAITFTRASNATFFDASGTLQTASNDTPRFDHSGGTSLGLLIEEARTNSIRNSQAGGAVAGVSGTMPTNWSAATPQHGLTREIVGTGTVNGLAYIDIKFSGTANATNGNGVFFETAGAVAATSGQTWTSAVYVGLVGAATGINAFRLLTEETNGSDRLLFTTTTLSGLTASLQRFLATRTFADAATTHARSGVDFSYTNGAAVDFTLRIAAPQLEQGAFATSYIPTTTAAATRAADSAVVTPISSFYNQSEGTLFAEGMPNLGITATSACLGGIGNSASEYIGLFRVTSGGTARGWAFISPSLVADLNGGSFASNGKLCLAAKADDFAFSFNGGSVATDTSGAMPSADRFRIGTRPDTGSNINGHIRKLAYWPRRLSNTLLQQLTT
jgi:hypothetical protein